MDAQIKRLTNQLAKVRKENGALHELAAHYREEAARLAVIRCPDTEDGQHDWNAAGRCRECCNFATELISAALDKGPIQ